MEKKQELYNVIKIFNEKNIKYWLDSGTLLGIYRDGKILDHDGDIDISACVSEEYKVSQLSKSISKDYNLRVLNYNGYNFKYKYTPKNKNNCLKIDINLFVEKDGLLLCPQPIVRKNILSKIIWKIYKTNYFNKKTNKFDTFICKIVFKMYTWKIPLKYFNSIKIKDSFYIPAETEKYLELRYGNWRIPSKKWSFVKDDGGLSKLDINNI